MPDRYQDESEALNEDQDRGYWQRRLKVQSALARSAAAKAKAPVADVEDESKKKKRKTLSERMLEDPDMARILAGDQRRALRD